MTESEAAELLNRWREEQESKVATRQSPSDHELSLSGRQVDLEQETAHFSRDTMKAGRSGGDPKLYGGDPAADRHEHEDALDGPFTTDLFDRGDLKMVRAIRSKVERIERRLKSLSEWTSETKSWTEKVEIAGVAQIDLGRLMREAQLRISNQIEVAEERARSIVADAEERAEELLEAAERIATERLTIERLTTQRTPTRQHRDADGGSLEFAATREDEHVASPRATPAAASTTTTISDDDSEALFEAIELFTRTNAELVNELSELISTIPSAESDQ